jgi:hypothetical protein
MTTYGPKRLQDLLIAGITEGSLQGDIEPGLMADQLIGPLCLRRLLYRDTITPEYIDRCVATTLGPYLSN